MGVIIPFYRQGNRLKESWWLGWGHTDLKIQWQSKNWGTTGSCSCHVRILKWSPVYKYSPGSWDAQIVPVWWLPTLPPLSFTSASMNSQNIIICYFSLTNPNYSPSEMGSLPNRLPSWEFFQVQYYSMEITAKWRFLCKVTKHILHGSTFVCPTHVDTASQDLLLMIIPTLYRTTMKNN